MAKRSRTRGSNPRGPARSPARTLGQVEEVSLGEATRVRYLNYALSVISSRALPDVRDGLKPVQRRILYTMWADLGIRPTGGYSKCARVVGDVMGRYHPHGDQSIYDALVRMAQEFSYRYPLIDGFGNFGSIDGDPPAAMRYTECRLMPIAEEFLREIRQATVDFRPNYSSTADEPVVLPARVPSLLINGASGIAVGMATNIPPYNLVEVCKGLLALLEDRELPVEKLTSKIKGPDFPTGGVILNTKDELVQIHREGQGSIALRGEYAPDPQKSDRILISSIPYGVIKDNLVERIGEAIANGKVPQLVNVKDLSTEDVRIELELKPGSKPDAAMAYLLKHTPLQSKFHVNMTCLLPHNESDVAVPDRLSLRSILLHFLDFRLEIVTRRLRHELEELRRRIHILEGFKIIFDNLDEAIQIIRKSDGKADAAPRLIKRFELSEIQADAVLETKLYKLGKLEIKEIRQELKDKATRAREIERLLGDESARWEIVQREIEEIAKAYPDKRRTRIAGPDQDVSFNEEDYIVDDDAWVIVSRDGYLKRQKSFTDVENIRVRDEDQVGWIFRATARRTLTLLTDRGIAYTLRVNDIPMTGGHGDPVQKLFAFDDGETIVGCLCHDLRCLPTPTRRPPSRDELVQGLLAVEENSANSNGEATNGHDEGKGEPTPPYAVALSAGGKAIRFSIAAHQAVSTKKGRAFMRLDPDDPEDRVLRVEASDGGENLCLATAKARVLIFPVDQIKLVSGAGRGVLAIKLDTGDRVLGFAMAEKLREGLQVRTSRGAVQTVRATKYAVTSRGGRGTTIMQRGQLTEVIPEPVQPVPPAETIDEGASK